MSLLNSQNTMCTAVEQSPVPSRPSEQIHHKLLNLRDRLDCLSSGISEKLAPVMNEFPTPVQETGNGCVNGLPPLFNQYSELIDHIGLVVDDINLKLESVNI